MAAVIGPHAPAEIEFHAFLLDQIQPGVAEYRNAAVGTLALHVLLVGVLWMLPASRQTVDESPQPTRRLTPLIDPPLTQTARNKAPLSNEIAVPSVSVPSPNVKATTPHKKFQAPPPAQVPQKRNPVPLIPQEPPKMVQAQPPQQMTQVAPPITVQPPPKSVEQPKLVLENLPPPPSGQGNGRLKSPAGGVQEAINEIAKSGHATTRAVGDTDEPTPEMTFGRAPAPTRPRSSLELVSDPKGIDFKPYLLQVLQTIRLNWKAVYPESARLGARGRVVVQFAVEPDGTINKAVFINESGAQALDRASISAISMSNRLPPLPVGYTGTRVVLQLNFVYNAAR